MLMVHSILVCTRQKFQVERHWSQISNSESWMNLINFHLKYQNGCYAHRQCKTALSTVTVVQ